LSERGFEVDVRPAREVRDLGGYTAVVLGAALYAGSWHGDARNFLARHKDALSRLPVAVFVLGPLSSEEKDMREARTQLDQNLAKVPWLRPASIAVFAGKFDPATLRFPFSLLNALPASPLKNVAKDARDWDAIRAWAESVAEVLGVNEACTSCMPR
jgi:menaquinone-dependent protoporphyrinogen oxidase